MKLIIAGSRDLYLDQPTLNKIIEENFDVKSITEIVNGCATGVDRCGYGWGMANGKKIKNFRADWHKFGSAAGPKRNRQMAKYGDKLLVIMREGKDTPGSINMIAEMINAGKGEHMEIIRI